PSGGSPLSGCGKAIAFGFQQEAARARMRYAIMLQPSARPGATLAIDSATIPVLPEIEAEIEAVMPRGSTNAVMCTPECGDGMPCSPAVTPLPVGSADTADVSRISDSGEEFHIHSTRFARAGPQELAEGRTWRGNDRTLNSPALANQ